MRTVDTEIIKEALKKLIKSSCTAIEGSALACMKNAYGKESSEPAKFALELLLKNAELAESKELPVCQDTGMAVVFLEIGQQVLLTGKLLPDAINEAVAESYSENYFRMSVVHPFTRKNTGNNTPAIIHTEIVCGDKIKISFMPKGFGSENMSRLFMLTPSQGLEGVKTAVVEAVRLAGSTPCPPVLVGVGIGGTSDQVMLLAKKALLRPVGSVNPDSTLSALEQELLQKINELHIGAQGFGGDTTAFAVQVECAPTHIAALPVGVNIQCNCVRFDSIEI